LTGLLFFCGASVGSGNLELKSWSFRPRRGGSAGDSARASPSSAASPDRRAFDTAFRRDPSWQFDIISTSFFLSRRALKPAAHSGMPRWQDLLFIRLSRSANDATDYFQIPTGRVVEVGTQVTI